MDNEKFDTPTILRKFEISSVSEVLHLYQKDEDSNFVWDEPMVLVEYLERKFKELKKFDRHYLKNSKVLALGSDLGCVGIAAACLGAQVVACDLPENIPLLDLNIAKNKHIWSKYGNIRSLVLEWGVNNDLEVANKILLTDCLIYRESIGALVETLDKISDLNTEILMCLANRESFHTEVQQKYWYNLVEKMQEYFFNRYCWLSKENRKISMYKMEKREKRKHKILNREEKVNEKNIPENKSMNTFINNNKKICYHLLPKGYTIMKENNLSNSVPATSNNNDNSIFHILPTGNNITKQNSSSVNITNNDNNAVYYLLPKGFNIKMENNDDNNTSNNVVYLLPKGK